MKRLFLLVALTEGCAAPLPHPTVEDAAHAGVALATLEQARETYLERCSTCHLAPSPREHTPAEWPSLVDRMAAHAHLSPPMRTDIVRYLIAVGAHP